MIRHICWYMFSIDIYSVYTPYPFIGLLLHLGALSFSSKYAWDTLSFCYLRIATCDVIFLVWCSFSYGSSDWILWGCTYGLGVCLLSWMCVVCFHSSYSPIFHQLWSFLTLSWVFVKLDYFHCQDSLLVLVFLLVDSRSIGYVSVTKGSEFCFWYCSPWVLPWRPLLLFPFWWLGWIVRWWQFLSLFLVGLPDFGCLFPCGFLLCPSSGDIVGLPFSLSGDRLTVSALASLLL